MKNFKTKFNFETCEVVSLADTSYLKCSGNNINSNKPKVDATRKTSGGIFLALITRLKKYQSNGIDYSYLNQYFRAEFKNLGDNDPMGLGYIAEILTYDPRNDDIKSYSDIFTALNKCPSSLDWSNLYDIIEGLNPDSSN